MAAKQRSTYKRDGSANLVARVSLLGQASALAEKTAAASQRDVSAGRKLQAMEAAGPLYERLRAHSREGLASDLAEGTEGYRLCLRHVARSTQCRCSCQLGESFSRRAADEALSMACKPLHDGQTYIGGQKLTLFALWPFFRRPTKAPLPACGLTE